MNKLSLEESLSGIEKMIRSLAFKVKRPGTNVSIEDLESEGRLAAIQSYHAYDPSSGTKFSVYAYPNILHSMKKYQTRNSHALSISNYYAAYDIKSLYNIGTISIDAQRSIDDEEGFTFDIPSTSGISHENDMKEFLFKGIPSMNKEIYIENVIEEKSMYTIANERGMTLATVFNIIKAVREKIQSRASEYDENI